MTTYNTRRHEALLNAAASEDAKRFGGDENITVNPLLLTKEKAGVIMSEEHRVLGHPPPSDSLASVSQSIADMNEVMGIPPTRMTRKEEARLTAAGAQDALRVSADQGQHININVNPMTLSKDEASQIQSEEHRILGYPPPAESLASEAQSIADRIDNVTSCPMTRDLASDLMSQEHRGMGFRPPPGSIAAQAQSLADKNAMDGGDRTMDPSVMRTAMGAPVTKDMAADLMSEESSQFGGAVKGSIASQAQSVADRNVRDGGDRSLYDA